MLTLSSGLRAAAFTLTAVALAGCEHYNTHKDIEAKDPHILPFDEPEELGSKILTSPVSIQAKPDGDGGFKFKFAGRFVDKKGNLDFSRGAPKGKEIAIKFNLRGKTPENFVFRQDGRDAIFIIKQEDFLGGAKKSPFQGDQFSKFKVSQDGKTLIVYDLNNDSTTYVYQLNFLSSDKPVYYDPDIENGGEH